MNSYMNVKNYYYIFKDISAAVHSSTAVDEVLKLVVWKVTEAFQTMGALIRIHNPKTDRFEVGAVHGMGKRYLTKGPASTDTIVTKDIKKNKVVIIDDIWNSNRVEYPNLAWEEGVRMMLDVALFLGNEMVAVLRLYLKEYRQFNKEEIDFLVAISTQCSCAINRARLIESQQEQYTQLAIQTEKLSALGRLSAGIAHEINNPMAGILLYATNMKKKLAEDSSLQENLQVIIDETVRCKSIILELLEFSRDREPLKSVCNVNQIIEKAISIVDNQFRLKHIALEKELSEDLADLLLDANQIEQVLINLLINAVHAINHNHGLIQVRSYMDTTQTKVILEIEDNGFGIAPEHYSNIFDPFFTTKPKGSGLGLAVSYGIIQNHQGEIQFSSQPKVGTLFTLTLPLTYESKTNIQEGQEHGLQQDIGD
ncbi:MAG TPA: ATP-binding protein [Desulfohalobiaceae bacterium]|nr:ATP-binding protein [Desulfohalobiaceae bacterium]